MNNIYKPKISKRRSWSEVETDFMLNIMKNKNILRMLDGKRYRNGHIFAIVEEELERRGFIKSVEQIRIKWKHLKQLYYKLKRNNNTSGANRQECTHWELLEELLSDRPVVTASTSYGIESQNLTQELSATDDTNSNMTENPDCVEDNIITSEEDSERIMETVETPTTSRTSKKKPVSKAYTNAMKCFSVEWQKMQEELQTKYIKQHQEIIAEEMQKQREWEEQFMRDEREASENFMNGLMHNFFTNMNNLANASKTFVGYNPNVFSNSNNVPFYATSSVSNVNVKPK